MQVEWLGIVGQAQVCADHLGEPRHGSFGDSPLGRLPQGILFGRVAGRIGTDAERRRWGLRHVDYLLALGTVPVSDWSAALSPAASWESLGVG
mgnify:CR=1 FL=1